MKINRVHYLDKRTYYFRVVVFMLMIMSVSGFAQTALIDSLQLSLSKTKLPEQRVDLLNALAYEHFDRNDSLALHFAEQALALSLQHKYDRGLKYAYTMVGLGMLSKGEFASAFRNFRLSHGVLIEDGADITAYNLNLMGNAYRDRAVYDSAEYFYKEAMDLGEQQLSANSLVTVYKNYGLLLILLWKNSEAIELLNRAESLTTNLEDKYLQAEIYANLGTAYENIIEYDKADEYFSKLCKLAQQDAVNFHLIKCELRKAELAFRKGAYSEALLNCFNAIQFLGEYEYPPQVAEIYTLTGEVYAELGQYDLASRYYFQALKITEEFGLRRNTAKLYAELAWVYKEQANFELALSYLQRSLELRELINDQHGISNSLNMRGLIYLQQKKYTEAIDDFTVAIQIRQRIGHTEGVSSSIFNLSLVYESLQQYEKALTLIQQAIAVEEKIQNPISIGISYNQMAALLTKMRRLDEAERYLVLASQTADQTQSILLKRNNFRFYAKLYEARGDYKRAYESHVRFQQIDDSIYTRNSATKLAELEALYRVEQKEQQIKLLSQEKELQGSRLVLQQARIRSQNIIIGSALLGLVFVSVFAFNIYLYNKRIQKANHEIHEQKEEIQAQAEELVDANEILIRLNRDVTEKNEEIQAQSEELMEANQTINEINLGLEEKVNERTNRLKEAYKELDTFFYRSSHDFRRPLTTFMGLAEVAKITVKDPIALELFLKVNETARNLDRMLLKLQSISDVGAQQLIYKEVFLGDMASEVVLGFKNEIQQKGIKTQIDITLRDSFYSYPAMVKIILENLVENAIQFSSPTDPYVHIFAYQEDSEVLLEIRDNGQGIDDELKDKIFDMYFRGNERSKGNGLGLYIVRKAVEKLNGSITWSGKQYVGTSFIVRLPMADPSHS